MHHLPRAVVLRRKLVYLALLTFACGTDDRPLQYGAAKVASAGRYGGPDSDAGAGGEAGSEAGGAPDAGAATLGGSAGVGGGGMGGTDVAGSGAAGQAMLGGSAGSAGAYTTGSAGSGASTGGGSAGGGSAGSAGDTGKCGDVDQNGVEDCMETLVQNARFDADITGWSADPGVTQTWKTEDARGVASSGSLALTYTTTAASSSWSMASMGQCLKAWGEYSYQVGARTYLPPGQAEGRASISLAVFGNDDCKGTFLGTKEPLVLTESGSWRALSTSLKMPPGTRSVLVRLAAAKTGAASSLEVRFDDILFRQK